MGSADRFVGRVGVVTGAASGIGRALATELKARGASLVLADVDPTALDLAAIELSARAVPTDVGDPEQLERLAAAAPDASVVCLNAGVLSAWTGPVWEAPAGEWERVLRVNLGGVVNGLRAFVPQLSNGQSSLTFSDMVTCCAKIVKDG
jgi:NAD(P)-dependent dehydrogenase (short-subunit alcohol dehydrogenase family)